METKEFLSYENARNHRNRLLYIAMLHEAFGNGESVVIGHHLTFDEENPNEIPSADTMIFDHEIAKVIWGEDNYQRVLTRLALEPCETRDELMRVLYEGREKVMAANAV